MENNHETSPEYFANGQAKGFENQAQSQNDPPLINELNNLDEILNHIKI